MMMWGLGVGYVISGMYFGWNLGLPEGGPYGMLAATGVVTVLYVTFVLGYAELACAMPRAGGAFVTRRARSGRTSGSSAAPPSSSSTCSRRPRSRSRSAPTSTSFSGAVVHGGRVRRVRRVHRHQHLGVKLSVDVRALAHGRRRHRAVLFSASRCRTSRGANLAPTRCPTAGAARSPACRSRSGSTWRSRASRTSPRRRAIRSATSPRGFSSAMVTLVVLAVRVFGAASASRLGRRRLPDAGRRASDSPLPLAIAQVVSRNGPLYHLL